VHLAWATLVAAETTAKSKNPILPSLAEIVWGTISFVILFAVLAKYAYPAVNKMMQDRSDRIRNNLEEADRVRGEAEGVLADYKAQLADARNEANRIIEEARQAAEQLRQELIQRADQEVAELRERQLEDLRLAQDRAVSQLQTQVRDLAIDLAERVVNANLDRERNLQLVDHYIAELNATGRS
jgi:F-type H+-transporting ATPase subunit b